MTLAGALASIGYYARWVLPAGLVAGILLPGLSIPLRAAVPACIAVQLLVVCLRIDFSDLSVKSLIKDGPQILFAVIVLQVITPLLCILILQMVSIPDLWAMSLVLVSAAAPITGSPNLIILLGGNPAFSLRVLVIGTLLLPVTCIPVLVYFFSATDTGTVAHASLVLSGIILVIVTVATVIRRFWLRSPSELQKQQLDGIAALLLALMVMGLVSGVHEAWDRPRDIVIIFFWAVAVNVGLQLIGWQLARWRQSPVAVSYAVLAGNRNIALFLTALPATSTEPLLLFIACYQIPMFLTPLLGAKYYHSG